MKNFIPVFMLLLSGQTLACINLGSTAICAGETVFKGSSYSQGATVITENAYSGQVTVRSISSGNLYSENVRDLDVTHGCLGNLCVGSKVLKGSNYSQGATIVGVNFYNQSFTVRSTSSANLYEEQATALDSTEGCLNSVCVGEKIFKGSSYTLGATVSGINLFNNSITVRSVSSGNLYLENPTDIDLSRGCVGNVCVSDKVFKNTSYSQGAIVMGVNQSNYKATVKSVSSGNLYSESIYDLETVGQQGPRFPQEPRRPQEPRYPQPPRPTMVTEQCTVSRLDPAGMFVNSYSRSASGYLGQDVKGDACRMALSDCSMEIRGRQSCNIVR